MKRTFLTLIAAMTVAAAFFAMTSAVAGGYPLKVDVTFNKDVAPILFKNCAGCHRPGESAPMSLLSFKDARPWARSIKEKVVRREMPPWHAGPQIGKFSNDRRISQAEIETIIAWVEGGAKEGDPRDLPPAPKFVEGWNIGKPDLVLTMPQEFTLAAEGPDEYQYFELDTNFKEDKYVQMAEARPGNRKIVHHINIFVQPPQSGTQQKKLTSDEMERLRAGLEKDSIFYREGFLRRLKPDVPVFDDGCGLPSGGGGERADGTGQRRFGIWLGGFVPGTSAFILEPGAVKKIPAGSKIILNVHYSKVTGRVEKDRSMVGLVFARQPYQKQVFTQLIANHYFQIPPGAESHRVTACWTAPEDIHIVGAAPHMHYRGKAMELKAFYPDGRSESLLNVPRYDFSWQTMYYFEKPVAIPRGTRLLLTAYFDNSAKNRYNPAPTKAVRWGDPTYDEMMVAFIEYTIDSQPLKPETTPRPGGAAQK